MTDNTEAQPEALRLADSIDPLTRAQLDNLTLTCAAAELRRQHAEIERLRALAATCYAGLGGECDLPVIWLDALSDAANGEPFDTDGLPPYTSAIRAQLVAQTNRAASAEQQVTALTQRLDMANRLNTDARDQLAQLSARQAAPNPWQQAIDHELVCLHLGVAEDATKESAAKALRELIQCHVEIAINPQTNGGLMLQPHGTPPQPEREPLTLAQIDGIGDATGKPSFTWHYEFARAIERAHGIGATND